MVLEKKGRNSVFGIFRDQLSLNRAVNRLRMENFSSSDISVLMQSKEDTKDFAFEKNTKAPEGATTGAAIAGAGVGGTVGGVAGGLIGLGIPEFEAHRYEGYVKEGGMLISVHADDKNLEEKAKKILEECGAKNIATTSEKKSTDTTETDTSYQRTHISDNDESRNNLR